MQMCSQCPYKDTCLSGHAFETCAINELLERVDTLTNARESNLGVIDYLTDQLQTERRINAVLQKRLQEA